MSGGSVSRGNGAAAAGIPAGARKMVQSLKEIVNLPDQEIYVTLKECGMDPSEAVQRLLSQDSFHEVKSKRDKKKEAREPLDSRSRALNNSSNRGGRGGSDRVPRASSIQSSSNDYGGNRIKPVTKKENGISSAPSSLSSGSSSYGNRRSSVVSEATSAENLMLLSGIADGSHMLSLPPLGHQHGWGGMPGQVSMADVVKMGRPQSKLLGTSAAGGNSSLVLHNQIQSCMTKHNYKHSGAPALSSEVDHGVHSSQDPEQQIEDISHERGNARNNHDFLDGWPTLSQPIIAPASATEDPSGTATLYSDTSKSASVVDDVQLHQTLHEDEIPKSEENAIYESFPEESLKSESISERKIIVDTSESTSNLDDDSMKNMSAYMSQSHSFEQNDCEVVNTEISSVAASLHNLSLQKEGLASTSLEDNPAVIIPRHLQVTNADCSHLSFGSFGSGNGTSFSGSFQSKPLQSNAEVTKVMDDAPSLDNSDARIINNYENDHLKSQSNEDAISRAGMSTINYDMCSTSEAKVIRDVDMDATHGVQYKFPLISGYGTSTEHNLTSFSHLQSNSQMQNLASLSTLMQPYSNSLPSSLLPPAIQPLRDLDLPFSSLLSTQSAFTKYGAPTSSVTGQSISMPEIKPSIFSNPPPTQSSPNSSIPPGLAVPQHLPVHPYSQAAISLGPFANMVSYPFLPQSYPYLPSAAFPHAYTCNGPFHQSPTAVHNAGLKYTLPQYKSNASVSSLPPPAAIASGYGNFGSSTNIPGNFSLNPSTVPTTTTLGFDETLSSEYKEGTHYLPSQQNENSSVWVHGGSSRTVSPLPPNAFYGFQGQNQLSSFRQAQQTSHYGAMGYLNLYQNQLGGPNQEHQQNPSEASSNGSPGNPSQQLHQIWQHGH